MRWSHMAVAGLLAAPLAMTAAPAYATNTGYGSAYAITAAGPVAIPPTTTVSSAGRRPLSKSLIALPANPVLHARALNSAAWAGHARASVAELALAKAQLVAKLVTATCEHGRGASHLVHVKLGGHVLAATPRPNSGIDIALGPLGTATGMLNKQVRNADGSLTVTAIELKVPLGPAGVQTISVASATCGGTGSGAVDPSAPDEHTPPNGNGGPGAPGTPGHPAAPAPKPTPVGGELPVTG
ncbi:hypothetical protein J4573_07110 [Actinomadura barringtoniae]|uniref:Uncharacterized protein n=1 Tax=Actinomadura barringtoniae TaxID=1427535 RepID=A0A939P795_9ACTN|nr:choice-of-anchor P family protein [Actinomadura barringtoniae]MBO2446855.1 hypothetical protein [Actinomadura barringtoniae]